MMIEVIAAVFVVFGGLLCVLAGVGVVRLRDIYLRMHASTKAGTLGLALICIAVMLTSDAWTGLAEALFVFLFMIATAPIGAHLISRAAFRDRIAEAPGTARDPETETFRESGASAAGSPD